MFRRWPLLALCLIGAGSVNATPITFDIDGPLSSATTSGISLCLGCSVNLTLNPLLDNQVFDLDVGESATFDFFRISASGIVGAIAGTVSAELAFELPIAATASGVAKAAAAWALGLGAGGLTFGVLGQPGNIAFGNGGLFSVAFSGASDTCQGTLFSGCTLSDTVSATVTLLSAPSASVPEPATLSLLGIGLLAIGFVTRRTRQRAGT